MEDYKYMGVELTPSVFAELLVLQFDGKQFKRETAIETIKRLHIENGGITTKNEYISTFKKACNYLKGKGMRNVGYGMWRLNYEDQQIELLDDTAPANVLICADKVLGNGKNSVYVYYFDTYKKLAECERRNIWACKIGRTEKNALERVLGQIGTAYPELPHVALILRCDNSSYLEMAIHSVLKSRGRWLQSAPGIEWFSTSPEEIERLYNFICDDVQK